MAPLCVVCAAPAEVYCHNDDANLCIACDHTVHSAHAIARTHRRTPIVAAPCDNDSLEADIAVPQDMMPLDKVEPEMPNELDLSFSDDGWFTVPDTACSAARGGIKGSKAKDFEVDDLFGFDAALDEEVAFALDPPSDLDCLVPLADEPEVQHEPLSQPSATAFKQEQLNVPLLHAAPAPAISPAPAPTAPGPSVPPTAFALAYPPVADTVSNVDSYIPHSLIPLDPSSRTMALAERREKVQRFREKKKTRQFKKLIRYASRKRYAEVRPRIKGRFARKDEIAAAKAAGVPLEC